MSGETAETAEIADIREILRLLPHRYPFVMIDRIIDIRGEDHGVGIKNVIQRAAFSRAFSREPGDARRARHRRNGANGRRAVSSPHELGKAEPGHVFPNHRQGQIP